MTTTMFLAYLGEIPALRAEALLDVAAASHPTAAWFDMQVATLTQQTGQPLEAGPTPFRLKLSDPQGTGSFQGLISPRGLSQKIQGLQDGGYA